MGRSTRNAVILASLETTSGTSETLITTDAVLLHAAGLDCKVNLQIVDRDVLRGGFGAPDKLVYDQRGQISFSIDIAGSGELGVAAAWDMLLQGCAFGPGVPVADTLVTHSLISTALKTLTIWAYWDGELRKFTYCSGSVKFGFRAGGVPTFDFTFQALVTSVTAAPNVVPDLSAWVRPKAVGPLSTTTLKLGCSYAAGALTGGTAYHWSEFNVDLANQIQDVPLVTQSAIEVDDRSPTCDFTLQMSAAEVVALRAAAVAGTAQSVGMVHGTVDGNKLLVFLTGGVIVDIADAPQGNKLLQKVSLSLPPVAAANDELVLVAL